MPDFVHLHNHTHYSLLDAACKVSDLVKIACDSGHKAVALTDHGVMFGSMEFAKKCDSAKIKYLIGFESYVATGSRYDKSSGKSSSKKKNYYHLILIAKNEVGYKNLIKLTTLAHTEGFYYKPRIDRELLEKYHEGIIASSACINGVINSHLVNNDYDTAMESAKYYQGLFGEDFYIELQNHYLPEDEIILRDAPKIARDLGIKLVATNDVHYIKKEHAVPHNVYLMIKDSSSSNNSQIDVNNLRYRTPEMYFKSTEEMYSLFREFPEALESTNEIADKCEFRFVKKMFLPDFPIPKDSHSLTLEDYLVELTNIGLQNRFPDINEDVKIRAEFELDVIKKMGFSGYFLIVQDFINAAKKLGVRVGPGRGSAAGSIVAYALGITNVDPLPYDLLFERFLNPERVSMPDIDIDFSDDKRELVIEYVKQKYGENSVAQIVTFGQLSSRAVLKDVGRVLGIPHTTINQITSKIPVILGKVKPLAEALELPELKEFKEDSDPQIKKLIEFSLILEGLYRNTSTHAAGVVIAPGEVSEFVPLYQSPSQKNQGSDLATQYNMKDLEDAGLLKMDFLGLRTLSIIENSLILIKKNYNIDIDIDNIDLNDEKTYEIFSSGNTNAVFQFESGGMKDYLRQLKPRNIEEITAMNALYRPGPMENIPEFIDRKLGKKNIEYLHPLMENSLKTTYGIIVYQEQVMQLARDIAGFSLGTSDILRRAMGKKNFAEMDKLKPQFIEGANKNNVDEKIADEIFKLLLKFADYGFNKSHSLAYSILAYQTAWLKAHYPSEFLAANMSAELNNLDKIVELINDAEKSDIKVLPPDINRSIASFNADEKTIYFGLAAIKNVGVGPVEGIIKARYENPFKSIYDFVARVDTRFINKRSLEALICAGAFDSLHNGRASLFASIEDAIEYSKSIQNDSNDGMESLFGESSLTKPIEPKLRNVSEWSERDRLAREKDVLNFYISGHPLNRYEPFVKALSTIELNMSESKLIGETVRVCGLIKDIRTRLDRRQNTIAFVKIEDFVGKAELIFWSDSYQKFKSILEPECAIMCIGKSEFDGEIIKIVVEDAYMIDEAAAKYAKGIKITADLEKSNVNNIDEIIKLSDNPSIKNRLIIEISEKSKDYKSSYIVEDLNLPINEIVVFKLMELFGKQNIKILTSI